MSSQQTRPTVTVMAEYRAHPGKGDEVALILPAHIAATRREPGCITFVAYRDHDDPDHFMLHEQYVDEQAHQAHRESPLFRAYDGRIAPLLELRAAHRYEEVPPGAG